jgi:hypothetical protein
MSDGSKPGNKQPGNSLERTEEQEKSNEPENSGPNLVLFYTWIAVALAAAIGFALLIVLPFYRNRH